MANEVIVVHQTTTTGIDKRVVDLMKQGYQLVGAPFNLQGNVAQAMTVGLGATPDIGEYRIVRKVTARPWADELALLVLAGWTHFGGPFEVAEAGCQAMVKGKILFKPGADQPAGGSNPQPSVDNFGWFNYENTLPSQEIPAMEWTTLLNNGAGPTTDVSFRPAGMTEMLDKTTGKIRLDELSVGDEIYIRHQINVIPSSGVSSCSFGHRFSTEAGEVRVPTGQKMTLDEGAGVPTEFFLLDSHFYMSSASELTSGMLPQIRMSNPAVIEYNGCYISITRR